MWDDWDEREREKPLADEMRNNEWINEALNNFYSLYLSILAEIQQTAMFLTLAAEPSYGKN
jgi:hypothetical protein